AIPVTGLSYRPHERSPSTQQIVWTMTHELRACVEAATQFRAEWRGDAAPSYPEMLALFEQWSNELTDVAARMDDASWNRPVQFYYQGRLVNEQPVGQFLWYILFDAIHHRGQLSTYLRPMGAIVPSIYGPSGDKAAS
ncbi:MAG: DinB family protein, partial [Myxococcales bacterium]